MQEECRISIRAGDVDIDLIGEQMEVEERMERLKEGGQWDIMLERLTVAADAAKITDSSSSNKNDRGWAFKNMIDNCNLNRKPDQVLAAIHHLRSREGLKDCPPRVIEQLFEEAGLEKPGNLSLYLNRLRERGLLEIPMNVQDKNRYAVLTLEGLSHLSNRTQS